MPDFEREFFQDNSEDESESASSDSNGHDSEEEAKHFQDTGLHNPCVQNCALANSCAVDDWRS